MEKGSKCHYKKAIIGPPANAIEMVFHWCANNVCPILCDFSGGRGPPVPSSQSAHGPSITPINGIPLLSRESNTSSNYNELSRLLKSGPGTLIHQNEA